MALVRLSIFFDKKKKFSPDLTKENSAANIAKLFLTAA
jgi:hypothetical protein